MALINQVYNGIKIITMKINGKINSIIANIKDVLPVIVSIKILMYLKDKSKLDK